MSDAGWTLVWAAILLPAGALEAWALVMNRPATLSRTVWRGLRARPFRTLFGAAWAWLTWHWIIEYLWFTGLRDNVADDVVVAVAGALLGLAAVPAEPDNEP